MSITSFSSPWRRAALAAALFSGSLALFNTPASAGPVLSGTSASAAPVLRGTPAAGGPVSSAVAMSTISGNVPTLIKKSTRLGVLPASQVLSCSITLPTRNQAALTALLHGLNDPADPHYGQYLTPTQFANQFGPSQVSYNALVTYLRSKGLVVTQTFPSRTYLSLTGTAGQLNSAFGVTLKQFQSPSGRIFHAPDTDVKVPAAVAEYISAVTGLDNAHPPVPLIQTLSHHRVTKLSAVAQSFEPADPLLANPGEQGSGPGGGFTPSDFRTVYNLNGTALDGTGQTIAIIEYGTTFNIKDTLKYEHLFGLGVQPITIIPVDGGSTTFRPGAVAETDLDIASQLSMAPNASLRVYLGSNNGSVTDAMYQVATDAANKQLNLNQLSISYGFGPEDPTETAPDADEIAINAAYLYLAAAGVSTYVSSGDQGSQADNSGYTSVDISSSAPMVCGVGGTTLLVQKPGTNENYKTESTWNDGPGDAGGGGVSMQWPLPDYQIYASHFASLVPGSNVSATNRNVPDISANADPNTGIVLYVSEDPELSGPGLYIFGGTSESAPLWAGFTALVNQNRALAGLPALGFPNNSLYPLAYNTAGLTSSYTSLFHDINDLSSNLTVTGGTKYTAVTGYDASTGLGSMAGTPLIAALSGGTLKK